MLENISYEAIIDYTIDFMRIVGVPGLFIDRVVILPIDYYRGSLPSNWIETIQVRDIKTKEALRYTTDSFHLGRKKDDITTSVDGTYFVQNGRIYTSFKTGKVELAYRAISVDEDGYPLLADNPKLFRALESYVKLQRFTQLFDMGKISPQILQNAQQDYAFNVGACETEFHKLELGQMEVLLNSLKTLLPRENEFIRSFINTGAKEHFKTH